MPIYEYRCENCGNIVEYFFKTMDAPREMNCLVCWADDKVGRMRKVISLTSFRLAGEGWGKDGYVSKKGEK